jgi:hypothetical protein
MNTVLMMLDRERCEQLSYEYLNIVLSRLKLLLKRYKAPGTDQISAERIQAGSNILHSVIHKFINSLSNKEEYPQR